MTNFRSKTECHFAGVAFSMFLRSLGIRQQGTSRFYLGCQVCQTFSMGLVVINPFSVLSNTPPLMQGLIPHLLQGIDNRRCLSERVSHKNLLNLMGWKRCEKGFLPSPTALG